MAGWRELVSLLLVLVMLGSVTMPAMAAETTVSLPEAKIVAEKFIARLSTFGEFKDWRNVKIGNVVVTYDINDNKSAYIVEVQRNGMYAGYIVVS